MKNLYNVGKKTKRFTIFCLFVICIFNLFYILCPVVGAQAMPFYDLHPEQLVIRACFFTCYKNSSCERKSNIKLCAKAIDNVLVDVDGEFSFNAIVGARTEERGYKLAKIILNGEFVDGVGGGVCQVSTTLYNAVLLAGLEILEYHAHSLPVSYVLPSFDAMVNSGYADFKFKNNTQNPVYIKAKADDERIEIKIFGQPMDFEIKRISNITEILKPLPEQFMFDEKGQYPQLREGEKVFLRYAKEGYRSEGYIQTIINGKVANSVKIRSDKYSPVRALILCGKLPDENQEKQDQQGLLTD